MKSNDNGIAEYAGSGIVKNSTLPRSLVESLLRTDEFRSVAGTVCNQVLNEWAGKSRIRKSMATILTGQLTKGFQRPDGYESTSVIELLGKPEFVRDLSAQMPGIFNAIIAGIGSFSEKFSEMPPEQSRFYLKRIIDNTDFGGLGSIITSLAKILNSHSLEPQLLAEAFRPGFRSFFAEVDFGEVRETVNSSAENITALAEMINEEMWEYPGKMVCLLSLIPSILNITVSSAIKTLEPVNRLAPDLLTDVIMSLVREIDGNNIGLIINQFCEIIRKVHRQRPYR